jgi:hypothetical protein
MRKSDRLLQDSSESDRNGDDKPIHPDKLTKRERLQFIYMPIAIVLLTAMIGTSIGVWFQNRSFRRNELFKARLDRIMSQQKEASDIRRAVDEARRQIRSNEDFIDEQIESRTDAAGKAWARQYYRKRNPMASSVAILKESKIRLDALADSAKSFGENNPVSESVNKFSAKLEAYLECLDGNTDFRRNCSDENPDLVESLSAVIIAHSKLADGLIKEFE